MDSSSWKIKVFYDGECPLCMREMKFLMRMNKRGGIAFEDTTSPDFDPKKYGISTDPNRIIHGVLNDGTIVTGVEVFRRAYREVGLGWLLAPTAWPVLKPIFDAAYLVFAKNRMRIGRLLGRKCDTDACAR